MADRSDGPGRPLIDSAAMVGEWDPDAAGWSALDWVAGPAGTVVVTLPGGVELEIDVASPGTFVGLWVDDSGVGRPDDHAIETLTALIGGQRTDDLLRTSRRGARQLTGDELGRRRGARLQSDPYGPGVAAPLAAHALAVHQATTPDTSGLVRALALVDAAASARELPGLGLDTVARELATQGVLLLLDHRHELGAVDRPLLGQRLREVDPLIVNAVARRGARRLARDLDARAGREPVASRAAVAPAVTRSRMTEAKLADQVRAAPVARLLDVDVATVAASYRVAAAAARATTSSELEVRVPGRPDLAERLWARAHDPAGAVLAVSRMVEHDGDAIARLLISPRSVPTATVDLTDRPADPLPSRTLRGVQDAIAHGRAAARADRLDDAKESFARWGRSQEAWRRVGDDDRAAVAQRFATDPDRARRAGPALLSDGVLR